MSNAIRFEDNIFMSEKVGSPFTLGFIRPKIYIPFGIDKGTYDQIIAHEKCHIRRGDHIIKPLAFMILSVHWFNPLCWFAFRVMSLDMEMSCDEKVLKLKGDEVMKKNYARALLSFATNKRLPAPSPIAFSESRGNAGMAVGGIVLLVVSIIVILFGWIFLCGLKVLKPQEALVLTLFGNYIGTLKEEGFYFVNPFCVAVNPAAHTKLTRAVT